MMIVLSVGRIGQGRWIEMDRTQEIKDKLKKLYIHDEWQKDCAFLLGRVDMLEEALLKTWLIFAEEVGQKRAIELHKKFEKELKKG